MNFDTNNHSVFLLFYHLVLVIKYRRNVIDSNISERLNEIFVNITPKYNIEVQEWNHDKDHIHVLFKAHHHGLLKKNILILKNFFGKSIFGQEVFVY